MEEADGGRTGAAGRSRELLGPTENVPVALLLPPEPAGHRGQHDGGRGGRGHVQQYVPDSFLAASQPPETPRPEGAHSWPWAGGATGTKPPVQPDARHTAPAVEHDIRR